MNTATSLPPDRPPSADLADVTLLTNVHQGMDVLSIAECEELLRGEVVGRIGFVDSGQPIILPINYAFVAGSLLFRTAAGSKLDIAHRTDRVAFEIDQWNVQTRSGWSVLAKGRAQEVTDDWFVALCEFFGVEPWADQVPRDHWIRIAVDELSGRWIFRRAQDESISTIGTAS